MDLRILRRWLEHGEGVPYEQRLDARAGRLGGVAMFVLARAITYATLFVGTLLVFLPARVLELAGVRMPARLGSAQALGLALAAAGALLALACIVTFVVVGKGTPAPFDPPRRLVRAGPYRVVRNPMYAGAGLALAGAGVYTGSWGLLAYALGFLVAFHLFVIAYEEPHLRRVFGAEYDAYCARTPRWLPRRRSLPAAPGLVLAALALAAAAPEAAATDILHVTAAPNVSAWLYIDPDGDVSTKEFAFVFNQVPAPDSTGASGYRDLFHLVYQRSGGLHAAETTFGHAWSADLYNWSVDTAAFAVDTTWWNAAHVWSPSIVDWQGKTYMFYTGVDSQDDQRIGYASTSLLDTTDTVWDPERVMVWEAADTRWAVPDPWIYSGQTQFRDAYVLHDPEHTGRLLMFYEAHDSIDFNLGRGGLTVGVARSDSGTVDSWEDLGYFPSTLPSVTRIGQLEGPHVFSVDGTGTGWRLMFSNAGSPPGEHGYTTIRFETLAPGESVADTTPAHWSAPQVLMPYLNYDGSVFGWSGSEELHVNGADYLAGFTAWGPGNAAIAMTRITWNGDDFTIGVPTVTAVDEYRSPARGVRMSLAGCRPGARRVTFLIDSPLALEARLEVFDPQGRRAASLLAGTLARGRTSLTWSLSGGERGGVPSGVYFARLSFAGGVRAVRIPVAR